MSKKIISVLTAIVLVASVFSTALTASAIIPSGILFGDVDNNTYVNTEDARLALMAAAGIKTLKDADAEKRADINNDGDVTLFDARQILRGVAGLVSLQPTGAFYGFTTDAKTGITTPETAIALFNACLNRVKTETPGFTKAEAAEVTSFDIEEISFVGVNLGSSVEGLTQEIRDLIVSEAEPDEAVTILKGENCDNSMSVESQNYVSQLNADDVLGINVSYNGSDTITISVALADCEIDTISQSAYADVFNTELIVEKSESVIESVFSSTELSDAKRKNAKNAVLTMSFDIATAQVISYTTTYETDMYILQSTMGIGSLLSAELKGIQYGTKHTVVYDNFQW